MGEATATMHNMTQNIATIMPPGFFVVRYAISVKGSSTALQAGMPSRQPSLAEASAKPESAAAATPVAVPSYAFTSLVSAAATACTACFTGDYPTALPEVRDKMSLEYHRKGDVRFQS